MFADHLLRTKKEYKNFNSPYIYQNELDKACFQQHDIAYGDFRNFPRRKAADNYYVTKQLHIAKNLKYDGYKRGLASMVYIFFDKKSSGGAFTRAWLKSLDTQDKSNIENEVFSN